MEQRMAAVAATVDLHEAIEQLSVGRPMFLKREEVTEAPLPESEAETIDAEQPQEGLPAPNHGDAKVIPISEAAEELPYYDRPALVLFLLCSIFPLGLYALYRNTTFSGGMKVFVATGWAIVVALIIGLAFTSGATRNAKQVVQDLNTSHRDYCQVELTGWSNDTLKVEWSIRARDHQKETILSEIERAKTRLLLGGVRYLKVPNKDRTYDLVDWKTGRTKTLDQQALPFIR